MPPSSPTLEDIHGQIDAWFQDDIRCGAIGQYTPAYNQAFGAIPDLKARITKLFPAVESTPEPGQDADLSKPKAAPAAVEPQE